ncbi:MAG: hypothetical protein ACFFCH_08700 [Promethearchaeota archaeon]
MFDEVIKENRIPAEVHTIRTVEALEKRLRSYYFFRGLQKSSLFLKRMETCRHYLYVLAESDKERAPSSIAKDLGLHHSIPNRWMQGQLPDLIRLAIQIPQQEPKANHKWLPLRFESKFTPTAFIQVPVKVHDFNQISSVVNQISPVQLDHKGLITDELQHISKMDAFAYVLGLLLRRSEKQGSYELPMKIVFALSKEYGWAKQAGETVCFLLGLLGIRTSKIRGSGPEEVTKNRFSWRTGRSPLISWMLQSVLGIKKAGDLTSLMKYASWLHRAPFEVRLKFLQALFDYSGSVSVSSQVVSLTCTGFERYVLELLETVGIESGQEGYQVRIRKKRAINRAALLPIFWQATSRRKNIKKLVEMLAARQGRGRKAYPPQIVKRIKELADEGLAFGAIAEKIYDESGISLPKTTIRRLSTK